MPSDILRSRSYSTQVRRLLALRTGGDAGKGPIVAQVVHWHYGNGEYGCLYDNTGVAETKAAAIASLATVFFEGIRGVKTDLRKYHQHIFTNPGEAGASICSISRCADPTCEMWVEYQKESGRYD